LLRKRYCLEIIKNKTMNIQYKKDGIELHDKTFISLEYINKMCNETRIKEDNLVLLKLEWNGRGGNVCETIALPYEKALRVKEILLYKDVDFGEIWGKHSQVSGEMCDKTFSISLDKSEVKSFLQEYSSGHEYNHSFIWTFIWKQEEALDEDEESAQITVELLDELQELIK
jgi:hypothetical protein